MGRKTYLLDHELRRSVPIGSRDLWTRDGALGNRPEVDVPLVNGRDGGSEDELHRVRQGAAEVNEASCTGNQRLKG